MPSPDLHGRRPIRKPPSDQIPPQSIEAEQAALGCALIAPECIAQIRREGKGLFYDLRHQTIWQAIDDLDERRHVVDLVTLSESLTKSKLLKGVGGLPYLMALPDKTPSAANLGYYLQILREKRSLRRLQAVCSQTAARIYDWSGSINDLMLGVQADMDMVARVGMEGSASNGYRVWNLKELAKYEPPAHLALVGDNELCMGYDGVALLAGPGSSGKSLAVSALALAAAKGDGQWMGRKVHRKFKLLILQSENGARRLKKEFTALQAAAGDLDLSEHVFVSNPPEGGLPFHTPKFRAWVRDQIERIKPDLVVIDTWAAVATEDAAKEVVEKLVEIRSTFPSGDNCPGLLIVAHTKKPRAEEVRKGRGLAFQVAGSIALVNTARCVYMLLPWSDDPEDDRIYWSCVKLNNGAMYPASVWHRRFGAAFEHDDKTDPRDWGRTDDDREAVKDHHLRAAFEKDPELKPGDLVKRLMKASGAGESTCWRAIKSETYLGALLMRVSGGKYKLKSDDLLA